MYYVFVCGVLCCCVFSLAEMCIFRGCFLVLYAVMAWVCGLPHGLWIFAFTRLHDVYNKCSTNSTKCSDTTFWNYSTFHIWTPEGYLHILVFLTWQSEDIELCSPVSLSCTALLDSDRRMQFAVGLVGTLNYVELLVFYSQTKLSSLYM
jgi:hypothetical protein